MEKKNILVIKQQISYIHVPYSLQYLSQDRMTVPMQGGGIILEGLQKDIGMMASFDYSYQNAFWCNLCYADLCHARAILHKRKNTEYNSLPQSILVTVVK